VDPVADPLLLRKSGSTHLILRDFVILIILREEYNSRSSSSCRFLHPPVTPSLFGPTILLSTLFSNSHGLCSSLSARDQVSHPYKNAGKIIVSYIQIFMFFESRREDRKFWTEWEQALPAFNLS
jgi:hypothetical protein